MAGKIFISYRPGVDLNLTRRLLADLQKAFDPGQLLFEVDIAGSEATYAEVLKRQLRECDVMVAIVGSDWSGELKKEKDYVRIEIEEALRQAKPVILVLLGGAQMPSPSALPVSIRSLPWQGALRVRNRQFGPDVQALTKALQEALAGTVVGPKHSTVHVTSLTPEIPEQGYGPHFEIGENGVITFAPPGALDRQGNNIDRLKKVHPELRDLSKSLAQALSKGNVPHNHLLERAKAYDRLIDQALEEIDFSLLYIAGVRLANAERAAPSDSDLPSLAVPVWETIDSLLQLHGAFILASREGIEAIDAEQRYQRTRQQEAEYRTVSINLAQSLQNQPTVVDPNVASAVLSAADEIGKGANPERSGTIATGIMRNVTITLATAAALGTLSAAALASGSAPIIALAGAAVLVATEGLKKSRPFAILGAFVAQGIDKTAQAELPSALETIRERFEPQLRFFLSAEHHFKRLASQGKDFKWLTKTVGWIDQQLVTPRGDRKPSDPPPLKPPAPRQAPTLIDNIYLAKVTRVEPALQAAFVEYGGIRHGFLAFNEIHPDYYQIPVEERQQLIEEKELAFRTAERERDRAEIIKKANRAEDDAIGSLDISGPPPEGTGFQSHNSKYTIEKVIKRRQVMLVEVIKDESETRGATLTTILSIAGRYLLLLPNTGIGFGISREIGDSERRRLKRLIQNLEVPEGMGLILRAAGASRSKPEIEQDFDDLIRRWEVVRDQTLKSMAPTLVYDASEQIERSPSERIGTNSTRDTSA